MNNYPPLYAEKLTKKFGDHHVLNEISFTLEEGEILGLLGANGAGKTTIIQMLLSIMTPSSGTIYYFGKDLAIHRETVLPHVSFASTYVNLPGKLTVYENLDIYGKLYGITSAERAHQIKRLLRLFDMWEVRNKQTHLLSAGQMTRVMLAKAFITHPRIILLDEPTASLDPHVAAEVRHFIITQQKEHGTAVLLTSHDMDEVTEICGRVLILKNGSIIANSSPNELAARVSRIRIHIIISTPLAVAYSFFEQKKLRYTQEKNITIIELEESLIASTLAQLAQAGILYSYITIEKPTLEDYFLQIARKA